RSTRSRAARKTSTSSSISIFVDPSDYTIKSWLHSCTTTTCARSPRGSERSATSRDRSCLPAWCPEDSENERARDQERDGRGLGRDGDQGSGGVRRRRRIRLA